MSALSLFITYRAGAKTPYQQTLIYHQHLNAFSFCVVILVLHNNFHFHISHFLCSFGPLRSVRINIHYMFKPFIFISIQGMTFEFIIMIRNIDNYTVRIFVFENK